MLSQKPIINRRVVVTRYRLCTCAVIKYGDLRLWQLNKLEDAYKTGKRKIQINNLSKEVGFDRKDVLEWFRQYADMSQERRDSLRSTLEATEKAKQKRRSVLTNKKYEPKSRSNNLQSWQEIQDVRKAAKRDKFSKDALRTMEMIFLRYRHPSDELVREIQDLHRLPRKVVLDWFAEKRRGERD